jgi:hypothetical protein
MASIPRFDGNYRRDILIPLVQAKPELAGDRRQSVRIVGPFPLYIGKPHRLVSARQIHHAARLAGWRALVLQQEQPVAVVDFGIGATGHSFHAIHGEGAAKALSAALEQMYLLTTRSGWTNARHAIRMLELPSLALSVIWKAGRPSRFIRIAPTEACIDSCAQPMTIGNWRSHLKKHLSRPRKVSPKRDRVANRRRKSQ